MQDQPPTNVHRYQSLDCIRGFAACAVMLNHFLENHLADHSILKWLPTRAFYASHSAVIIFFVLSGFALFLLFDSAKSSYGTFISSRWLRIYPTYLCSIIVAIAFAFWAKINNLSWYSGIPPFDVENILEHVVLIGPIDVGLYNGVIWSLVHEMRISLLFPAIYWAVKKHHWASIAGCTSVSLIIGGFHYGQPFSKGLPELVGLVSTAHYATFFVYGAAIAKNRDLIILKTRLLPPLYLITAALFSLAGYAYLESDFVDIGRGWLIDVMIAICSCGIVIMAITFPIFGKVGLFRYLGRISFSLYLIHIPIGFFLLSILHVDQFTVTTSVLSIVLSLIFAEIMWRSIEARSLRWSRSARFSPLFEKSQVN